MNMFMHSIISFGKGNKVEYMTRRKHFFLFVKGSKVDKYRLFKCVSF